MKIIILLSLLGCCYCTSVQFTDCGSVDGLITNVDIVPCDDPTLCAWKKGQTVSVSIEFTTNMQITSVNASLTGIIQNIPIPFPLPNTNGCVMSGLLCPLSSNASFTYTQSVALESDYPSVPMIMKWKLGDQSGKDIVCFLIQTSISNTYR